MTIKDFEKLAKKNVVFDDFKMKDGQVFRAEAHLIDSDIQLIFLHNGKCYSKYKNSEEELLTESGELVKCNNVFVRDCQYDLNF